jgi:hypothetical protein
LVGWFFPAWERNPPTTLAPSPSTKHTRTHTNAQIRTQVTERLGAKYPSFDFESPSFKKDSKAQVSLGTLVVVWD